MPVKISKSAFVRNAKNAMDSAVIEYQWSMCPEDSFYCTWRTGGMSGGNCWDGKAQPYHVNEPTPDGIPALDDFLLNLSTDINFLVYKKLMHMAKYSEYTEHEYYGNRSDYGIRSLSFEKVWGILCKYGIIDPQPDPEPKPKARATKPSGKVPVSRRARQKSSKSKHAGRAKTQNEPGR